MSTNKIKLRLPSLTVVNTIGLLLLCGALASTLYRLPAPLPPPPPEPPAPIKLPAVVKAERARIVRITAETEAKSVRWRVMHGPAAADLAACPCAVSTYFVASVDGDYRLLAVASIDGEPELAETTVRVGPAPPVPPGPTPGPTPPPPGPTPPVPPGPTPGPAPIPADGLHVLVVYESQDGKPRIASSQWYALNSKTVLEYLNAKARGKWRIWDKDAPTQHEAKIWQDAMARAKSKQSKLPWIIVSNGKAGFEGPLPERIEDILALLKEYGGE